MNRGRGGSRRPNRGGGRFNIKPRTLNRAALSSAIDEREDLEGHTYDDEFDDVLGSIREPSPDRKSPMPTKTKGKYKAPIQRLHMSAENQGIIEEVLRDLQLSRTSNYDCRSLDLSAKQVKRNEAYWKKVGDQKLVIESGINFAADRDSELIIEADEEVYSSYAVKKLLQCGFEKKRCTDALKQNDGDLGAALESLLCNCCKLNQLGKKNPDYSEEMFQEAAIQRQDEVMALESIYNEAFIEVIADSVWTIKFSLPFLLEEFKPNNSEGNVHKRKTAKKAEKAANVCRFFLQGYCKFGDKCRLSHDNPDKGTSSNETKSEPEVKDGITEGTDPSFPFHLEVRFCKGSLYPFEPPLVVFYSTHESIPSSGCLNVTLRLNREAKDLCDAQSPAIFCLASLLESEEEVMACFKMPPSEYSLPVAKTIVTTLSVSQGSGLKRNQPSVEKEASTKLGMTEPQESTDVQKTHEKNRKLKQQYQRLQSVPAYKSMLEERKKLPAWQSQDNIIQKLQNHQVVVISGMTGCGKTTQIPQFILDDYLKGGRGGECFIICTQPRRISAMSVAERVSNERVNKIGQSVGYQVRLENKQSAETRLLYCTTGILLRRLEGESSLPGVSHIIVDEVHERTEESDFLMMVLKDLLSVRADVRVILMSATLNAQLFSEYFYDAPVIHIPGRTFPVMEFFLEDSLDMTKQVSS
ncbi:hypothetical protein ACROYT_G039680 [Oculina patagonica]